MLIVQTIVFIVVHSQMMHKVFVVNIADLLVLPLLLLLLLVLVVVYFVLPVLIQVVVLQEALVQELQTNLEQILHAFVVQEIQDVTKVSAIVNLSLSVSGVMVAVSLANIVLMEHI